MQGIITVILLVCLVYIGVVVSRYADGNLEAFQGRIKKRNFKRTKLWQNVCEYYGLIAANNIFPMTYILPNDLHEFNCDYDEKKQYISKTLNSGMRKGIFLHEKGDSLDDIAVIQEYIPNPLLINGFKFDIRSFLLVECGRGIFLYRPFYNVFTELPFDYKSRDRRRKINQAGTQEKHYDVNGLPRTSQDLEALGYNVDSISQDLIEKLRLIVWATPEMCNPADDGKRHMFGVDTEILSDGSVKIIEINSDPQVTFDDGWKKRFCRPVKEAKRKGIIAGDWVRLK